MYSHCRQLLISHLMLLLPAPWCSRWVFRLSSSIWRTLRCFFSFFCHEAPRGKTWGQQTWLTQAFINVNLDLWWMPQSHLTPPGPFRRAVFREIKPTWEKSYWKNYTPGTKSIFHISEPQFWLHCQNHLRILMKIPMSRTYPRPIKFSFPGVGLGPGIFKELPHISAMCSWG